MTNRILALQFAALAAASIGAAEASACSHLWQLNEVYTNADGSIQFVEMHVPLAADGEIFIAGLVVKSLETGKIFQFPGNLKPPSGFKYLLLATQTFADLPGAPTPDYIIPPNFFATTGDTLVYHIYDSWTFTQEQLPTRCGFSLNRDRTTGANTPTNYPGETGYGDPCGVAKCPADFDGSGTVDGADLAQLLGSWATRDDETDLDGSGTVDAADLAILLGAQGRVRVAVGRDMPSPLMSPVSAQRAFECQRHHAAIGMAADANEVLPAAGDRQRELAANANNARTIGLGAVGMNWV